MYIVYDKSANCHAFLELLPCVFDLLSAGRIACRTWSIFSYTYLQTACPYIHLSLFPCSVLLVVPKICIHMTCIHSLLSVYIEYYNFNTYFSFLKMYIYYFDTLCIFLLGKNNFACVGLQVLLGRVR